MRVLVTGAKGRVGRAVVQDLVSRGYSVRATDLVPPSWDRTISRQETPDYICADLQDAGSCRALVESCDAVVHAGAIPQPRRHPDHVVFTNNMTGMYNIVHAAIAEGITSFVSMSSETVPGFIFASRHFKPQYLPIDELHPCAPQDPYALGKWFGELLLDRVVERCEVSCTSLRLSWVQDRASYPVNIGPVVRDPSLRVPNYCGYVDVEDVADATATVLDSALGGHNIFYVAASDNAAGIPFRELMMKYYDVEGIALRDTRRLDASPIDCGKIEKLLGWEAKRSWRDSLDDCGRLRDGSDR